MATAMVIINLVLLTTLLVVVLLQGFDLLAVWTAVPLLGAAVLAEITLSPVGGDWAKTTVPKRFAVVGLVLGVVVLTLYSHLTLFFGIGTEEMPERDIKVQYLLAPVYALVGGGAGYVIGHLVGSRMAPEEGQEPARHGPSEKP